MVKPHGVRGALKVHLFNPKSTTLEGCHEVLLAVEDAAPRRVAARHLGATAEFTLLELADVHTHEAAEALRGARLLVERRDLAPCTDDEYYVTDLVGCAVEDEQGRALGTVHEVLSAGAGDVLVIRDATSERMIPFVDDWVTEVDLPGRRIRVTGAEHWEPTRI